MADGRDLPTRRGAGETARPDGGRRAVVVAPEEIWQRPRPATVATPPPELAPVALRRDARRSFMGPVLMVMALSTALMAGFLLGLALLWWRVRSTGG